MTSRTIILALCVAFCGAFASEGQAATCKVAPTATAAQVLQATNKLRQAKGLPALRLSPELTLAAEAHACDMARKDFFSHTGSDGSDIRRRITRAGYRGCLFAENIAWGYTTVQRAMTGWEGSPGHLQNMLHPRVKEMGLALALDGPKPYWSMVLASPC